MAPVEILVNHENPAFDGNKYSFNELKLAVRVVLEKRGILAVNDTEDDQTAERHLIITVGQLSCRAYPVALIGFDASRIDGPGWTDTSKRDHKLIVPDNHPEIIDEVKAEVERQRDASKFSTASSAKT